MNRFKDLCSDNSDSDEEVERGNVQRGRVRETKRYVQAKKADHKDEVTAEILIPKKKPQKPKDQKPKNNEQLSLELTSNEYKNNTSLNANQKFIRQQLKPVQQMMHNHLKKMEEIKNDRKKFTNALTTCNRDLQKVQQQIIQIHSEQQKSKSFSLCDNQNKTFSIQQTRQSSKLNTTKELQSKITLHLSKLMKQHQKTIELLVQRRKDMQKSFEGIQFKFLELKGIEVYNNEFQSFQQFGIAEIYRILELSDSMIEEITTFSRK